MQIMTCREAEEKYNREIVDRTHYRGEEVEYWLNTKCIVNQQGKKIEITTDNGDPLDEF